MFAAIVQLWQRWLGDIRALYVIVCIKTIVVVIMLLVLWALEGKNSAPVYMRF